MAQLKNNKISNLQNTIYELQCMFIGVKYKSIQNQKKNVFWFFS